ncbi:hypothetical protein SERLA73DRAFT_71298 [Serpula lacrymans var. lacrymans S7.3]|uniref:Uncharacterized protein n=1 Tax=Serpula lacrymans var. lacrymans (strain S7.3) TaxID=936435 RepID=F8PQ03_SERL3|nr:hypothetical protein SERLA73DRAFT_71298 [Serpula lacrymans var. lacrymans S7.3]
MDQCLKGKASSQTSQGKSWKEMGSFQQIQAGDKITLSQNRTGRSHNRNRIIE